MDETTQTLMHIPARIARLPDAGQRVTLLEVAKMQAFDPAIFDTREPFFWAAHISNDRVDSYFTHMLRSTLTNFAAEAQAGISFMQGHNVRQMPTGRSLTGALEEGALPNGASMRVRADFYTLSDLKLDGGRNTNEFIDGVRSGLIADVSVGFHGGRISCDICGRDWYDWDCRHVPGLVYEIKDADGVMRERLSTWSIDNAHLAEVSGVYEGATPDATILKAERMAGAGLLKPETARVLETRYRIHLPGMNRVYPGATLPEKGNGMNAEEQLAAIRAALTAVGYDGEDLPGSVARILVDLDTARAAQPDLSALEAEAADGRTYRADLLTEALAEGVRAFGDKFNRATYEGALKTASLATIRQVRDDWAGVAAERFPGGRQTSDAAQNGKPQGGTSTAAIPDSAYRV